MRTLKTLALLLVASTLALANPKLAKDLPSSNAAGLVDVIVQFRSMPGQADLDQLGHTKRTFNIIRAVQLTLPAAAIRALANNPNVVYVSPDRPAQGALDITTQAVNANLAWQFGWDGTGVGVAVIDSGVTAKNDFTAASGTASRVVYNESFVTGQGAADAYGHGTHVAGIVGSNGRSSSGLSFKRSFLGVAPNVSLINLRVLDQNGAGTDSGVIAAIQRAIALKSTYNIRVMNLSLGRPVFESFTLDPLCQAVEAAWNSGIVVVVAAGNYGRENSRGTRGYGTIAAPGNDPYVITVGAMNTKGTPSITDDTIASYSSKGPTAFDHFVKPDIVAPGNRVISELSPGCALATLYPKTLLSDATYNLTSPSGFSGDYFTLSGTSMATPVVSGAAALLIQKQPSLTPDQVKARLMKTANKMITLYSTAVDGVTLLTYATQSDIFTVGAGYLDINAALNSTDLSTLPALSPVVVYNSTTTSTHKVSLIRDFSVVWGDSILWGDAIVWGGTVFSTSVSGSSVIWGDSVVWGDNTLAGFSVVWGDSALTGTTPVAFSATDDDGEI